MKIIREIVTLWDEQGLPAPTVRVQCHASALRAATIWVASGFNTPREILAWTIHQVREANRVIPQ